MDELEIIKECLKIRYFEEEILNLFSLGKLRGTTHTCIGQEYIPIIYSRLTSNKDFIFSNHRGHGHFLAHTKLYKELLCEILGRKDGIGKGIGGSQHLHYKRFFSNGILSGMMAIAYGASRRCKKNDLSLIYLGDGATSEGLFHEVCNYAGLHNSPFLIVIENNKIAQSTDQKLYLAGSLIDRIKSYGLEVYSFNQSNILDQTNKISDLITKVRKGIPMVHIHECNRMKSHSKGDDTRSSIVLR